MSDVGVVAIGAGALVIVGMDLGADEPVAVLGVWDFTDLLEGDGSGRPLGILRAGMGARREVLEHEAIHGVGRLHMPDLEKLEPMADYRHDDRKWVSMNLAHQRRAGLRSSAIPRVICPA